MDTPKTLRYIARTVLLILAILIFLFALFSGAEDGLKGILLNSPNALTGLFVLVFIFIAWKWELVGGILIVLTGIFAVFFFGFYEAGSRFMLFIIPLPLIVLGGFLIMAWYMTRRQNL
ncbi:hypothetical protein ACFL1B_05255 [Nanoarchaeota archaeon]